MGRLSSLIRSYTISLDNGGRWAQKLQLGYRDALIIQCIPMLLAVFSIFNLLLSGFAFCLIFLATIRKAKIIKNIAIFWHDRDYSHIFINEFM